MESFIGQEIKQSKSKISLHLDNYSRKTIEEYQLYFTFTRALKPKLTTMQQGNVLDPSD